MSKWTCSRRGIIYPDAGADHLVDILKDLLEEAGGDPASVAVLDVAAGTGIAGEGLAKAGFNKITALDFSPEMLKVAEKKGAKKGEKISSY